MNQRNIKLCGTRNNEKRAAALASGSINGERGGGV